MRWMGLMSALVLFVTWAALDDITTGNETDFAAEYAFLLLSGLWYAGTSVWLMVRRHRMLGAASLAAVAVGVLACWSLPHRGEPVRAVNLLGWISLVWFLALSAWLLTARGHRWTDATRDPAPRAGDFRVPGRG